MRRSILIVLALLIPPAATVVVAELNLVDVISVRLRYPRRFAEVEARRLFRGGYPSGRDLSNLLTDKDIRTVVSLTGEVDQPHEREMLSALKRLKLRHLRFPMPGDGRVDDLGVLDKAADALNNAANWPIFFHCQAGKQRSNAVQAAYRMKHCGWTLEEALIELETRHGLDREGDERPLAEHLAKYAKWLGVPVTRRDGHGTDEVGGADALETGAVTGGEAGSVRGG